MRALPSRFCHLLLYVQVIFNWTQSFFDHFLIWHSFIFLRVGTGRLPPADQLTWLVSRDEVDQVTSNAIFSQHCMNGMWCLSSRISYPSPQVFLLIQNSPVISRSLEFVFKSFSAVRFVERLAIINVRMLPSLEVHLLGLLRDLRLFLQFRCLDH